MVCSKCGSDKVSVQMVTSTELKEKKQGILYWMLIGWWLKPILWLLLTLPMIFVSMLKPKKYKTKTRTTKMAICNSCGKSWKA